MQSRSVQQDRAAFFLEACHRRAVTRSERKSGVNPAILYDHPPDPPAVFAREGYLIILVVGVLSLVLAALGFVLGGAAGGLFYVLAMLSLAFTLYFFRDPVRVTPDEAKMGKLLVSPADGKVVVVQDVAYEPLYIKGPAKQISIFLSPLDVHVNRIPADGQIEYAEYVPGDYLVAWHPKASEKNERSQIGLVHPSGNRVLFKQIAGAVARRIVYHIGVGDRVHSGQRFGIVKFGSRMDVLVPPHVQIGVQLGDKVQAGLTVIGRFPDPEPVHEVPADLEPAVLVA